MPSEGMEVVVAKIEQKIESLSERINDLEDSQKEMRELVRSVDKLA